MNATARPSRGSQDCPSSGAATAKNSRPVRISARGKLLASARGAPVEARAVQRTPRMRSAATVVCYSHLRWAFVHQRPQHLMERCARDRQVIFVEEPRIEPGAPQLEIARADSGVVVATPHIPELPKAVAEAAQRALVDELLDTFGVVQPILWFYTPMAVGITRHLAPRLVVYDCMDELSLFANAPPELAERERLLLARTDVMFTGGHALFEHKRHVHPNVHAFPSSVDVPHFARARGATTDPADQAAIPHPRAGFFGVIDERMDLALVARLAELRPELHLVMLGPLAKIDETALPRRSNLHWLGARSYAELPSYLAGWDVALLPFARNDATRFISPTKTPEYLAAGKPVVSTSIRDVVQPYGALGLARIADDADGFAAAIDAALAEDAAARQARADAYLADLSWDRTWGEMWALVEAALDGRPRTPRRAAAGAGAAPVQPHLSRRAGER